ncbi:MAG: metallophosphoesterase [Terracidiphilus sp.]|nr:metallophosphoesterase [Terracidiphilus sp.]
MKGWPILGIVIVQIILLLAHWFLYSTWLAFGWPMSAEAVAVLRSTLLALSFLFVVAAVLGFRFNNILVSRLALLSSLWLGLLNFLFFGAWLAWGVGFVLCFVLPGNAHLAVRPWLAGTLLATAVVASIYGLINARILRLRHVTVKLDRLPASWRGRRALLYSDVHLGHINGVRFARRIARIARTLNPDVIFVPGDLFDGVNVDPAIIAAPLLAVKPSFGTYFVAGNHEEFGDAARYCDGLRRGGWHVLDNQSAEVDGLRIVGVSYSVSTHPMALRQFLQGLHLGQGAASILLQHVPNRLPIVEQAGASLMLCGHTHGGQIFPFSWITRRAFGKFTYGLQQFGALQVLTSSGIGTWGPPMRVGTAPEAVLLTFE